MDSVISARGDSGWALYVRYVGARISEMMDDGVNSLFVGPLKR